MNLQTPKLVSAEWSAKKIRRGACEVEFEGMPQANLNYVPPIRYVVAMASRDECEQDLGLIPTYLEPE